MTETKYITTTLPYINSTPHLGHTFEFVLADIISQYYRNKLGKDNMFFNVGVDEHGQKIQNKAIEEGYVNTQEYCDDLSEKWKSFCSDLHIEYDNFYRTTSPAHRRDVLRFYKEIQAYLLQGSYTGKYCIGCESFITEKELVFGACPIHKTILQETTEVSQFFPLSDFKEKIKDILIDKNKSEELKNIISADYNLSITRKNVQWGISTEDGEILYVWFEALLNYIFAVGYYEDKIKFDKFWPNSLIICGKDNLKFQGYILQALLLSNGIPQTKELLVHGTILDDSGNKLSKSAGNTIDPIDLINKYGVDALRYYLFSGLNIYNDSSFSEEKLVSSWNNDIVKGLGNLISRLFHLIDIKQVDLNGEDITDDCKDSIDRNESKCKEYFENHQYKNFIDYINSVISKLNSRISQERPFDKNCPNPNEILHEIYWELKNIIPYFTIILKENKDVIDKAFSERKTKIILFNNL